MLSKQFTYWYSYFDTLFLSKKPAFAPLICPQLTANNRWPISDCSLPALCSIFSLIQQFILQQANWKESICTIDELNKIQSDVTNVRVLLQIEKMYIISFWGENRRRVEASVAHLYSMLQLLIGSIIPYENMTLLECRTANKLCVQLFNLQELFKNIMNRINPICNYFSNPFFAEEQNILRNFFQNLVTFMKMAHQIKKSRMFHISNLLKYVTVVNPIEISRMGKNQQTYLKSKLISQAIIQLNKGRAQVVSEPKIRKNHKRFGGFIINLSKNWLSCPKKRALHQLDENYASILKLFCFNFPTSIRGHSIKHRKQSLKLNLQNIGNFAKGKSYTEVKRKQSPLENLKTSRQKKKSIPKQASKHKKSSSLATNKGLNISGKNELKSSVTSVGKKGQQNIIQDQQEKHVDGRKSALNEKQAKVKRFEREKQPILYSVTDLEEKSKKIINFFAKYIIASRISTVA